jgi:hypothetical protein
MKAKVSLDSADDFPLGVVRSVDEAKWRIANYWALVNAALFLIAALAQYVLAPASLTVILSAPAIFFIGGLITFVLMVQSGAVLAPIAWFVLGSSIYFGLGAVAGGLRVHPYSALIFGADILYLTRVNLLNACSVLLVVASAFLISKKSTPNKPVQSSTVIDQFSFFKELFPYILAIAIVGACSKFIVFPIAENLLLRSLLDKVYMFIPTCLLLLGMLWRGIGWPLRALALSILVLEILNGLLAFTKYQIIYAMLALAMGVWIVTHSKKFIVATLVILGVVFAVINPVVTLGRAHLDYDANTNTLATRIGIVADVFIALSNPDATFLIMQNERIVKMDLKPMNKLEGRVQAVGRRFDVASIQGYLVNEYNNGRAGNTLSEFWVAFIPRIIWPEKPIVTRPGGELNAKYYNDPNQTHSSMAPTYSAEAYWNYGPAGVVIVSVLLGAALGWLTRYALAAIAGVRPEYFIIAVPAAIWACFVESWVVSGYLGAFIILVVILMLARLVFACAEYLKLTTSGLSKIK